MLFEYPPSTRANRNISKTEIYERQGVRTDIKNLFVNQVEKILWAHKLADSTLNVAASEELPEFQVFQIFLKENELDENVLTVIDTAIPSPIIFELHANHQIRAVAAFKPFGDTRKSALSRYFYSDWHPVSTERHPIPFATNIEALYSQLLGVLLPHPAREGEDLSSHIERIEQIEKLERTIERTELRLRREKQLNRQAPLNRELRAMRKELSELFEYPSL